MILPIDPDLTPVTAPPAMPLDVDEAIQSLTQHVVIDTTIYAQIDRRRSQLEDAETLRRARAL